jgi:Flp pilus assembly protein TadD
MTVRFCPQCGTKIVPQANFCATCGEALPGTSKKVNKHTASVPISWRTLAPGLTVLSLYLIVGTGLWVFVLRSQPFPSATPATTSGPASKGGSQTLPQDHPQVTLPDDVKKRIDEFVNKANAAPQDVNAWKTLAQVQFRAAQIDGSYRSAALSSFQHVLQLAPNDLDALRGVGNVYYDFEEHPKAIEYYQKYLTLKPDDPSVRTDLGTMYLYSGDTDRAIAEYHAVLAQKPDFYQAYYNLGVAHRTKGDTEKSLEFLTKAKSYAPENVRPHIDQIIAQFNGNQSPAEVAVSQAATDPSRSPFQQAVEKSFRSHEIMGPRINRIEWPAPAEAKVFLQNFPMSGMPPEVRERFLKRLRTQVNDAKNTNGVNDTAKVELIDLDTQQIMETISS